MVEDKLLGTSMLLLSFSDEPISEETDSLDDGMPLLNALDGPMLETEPLLVGIIALVPDCEDAMADDAGSLDKVSLLGFWGNSVPEASPVELDCMIGSLDGSALCLLALDRTTSAEEVAIALGEMTMFVEDFLVNSVWLGNGVGSPELTTSVEETESLAGIASLRDRVGSLDETTTVGKDAVPLEEIIAPEEDKLWLRELISLEETVGERRGPDSEVEALDLTKSIVVEPLILGGKAGSLLVSGKLLVAEVRTLLMDRDEAMPDVPTDFDNESLADSTGVSVEDA
ncbi:hypothetical protein BN1723_007032 [Verticillium longisporum]|uniref:Uncharacterized protein n=1 Tax=Verticillium longisporum TaxID=100787 RepID=A0A0G4NIW1_VERLO|nr:hypothetical protein BN1723_007032 [Verticillium longisporum]